MEYLNHNKINTLEKVNFPENLGDVYLESLRTTDRVIVGRGTNLIVKDNIFCKSLQSLGKIKANGIICEEHCTVVEYEADYVQAFTINGEIINRNITPNSSPLFVSVQQIADKREQEFNRGK